MKKTLLVAALAAGFAGVAHAESSVTLYGVADAGYGYSYSKFTSAAGKTTKTTGWGAKNGVQNGSRWGLKGSEDLGNGTSAIFQIEEGFQIGDGGYASNSKNKAFGRQAYVGLAGDSWGSLTIGRQYNAADAFVSGFDPFATGFSQAGAQSVFGAHISMRADNAIKYVSPNFSGFQFGLGIAHSKDQEKVNGSKTKDNSDTLVTFGLGYSNAGLELGASFDASRTKKLGKDSYTQKAWAVGAAYDFDVVKVSALFAQQRDGAFGSSADNSGVGGLENEILKSSGRAVFNDAGTGFAQDGYRSNAWLVGLSAPVGEAGKVMFSYAGSSSKNTERAAFDGLKVKGNMFSLGYRHGLSKRTSLYAVASYGDFKVKQYGKKDKLKSTEVIVGLTHKF